VNTSIFHLEWLLNNETARSVSERDHLSSKYVHESRKNLSSFGCQNLSLAHQAIYIYIYIYIYVCVCVYRGADKSLARPISRCILFDDENISFDASLVIYISSTNIPPIMIINRIYEHKIFCRCSLFPSWSG
jgi:hypothetical protein